MFASFNIKSNNIEVILIMDDVANEDVVVVVVNDDNFLVLGNFPLTKQTQTFNIYKFFCSGFTIEINIEWHSSKDNYWSADYQPWYLEHNFFFSLSRFNGFCIILLLILIVIDLFFLFVSPRTR